MSTACHRMQDSLYLATTVTSLLRGIGLSVLVTQRAGWNVGECRNPLLTSDRITRRSITHTRLRVHRE